MPRQPRIDLKDHVYHVINRTSGRVAIFKKQSDFQLFESVLTEAQEKFSMRILAYCVMPNHFHLALLPREHGDLAAFMGWFTKTHTLRWHSAHRTLGHGHLYQGRYKSFIVNTDAYFFVLMKYIEQNPLRAKLVKRARVWKWGSLYRRTAGTIEEKKVLAPWPMREPKDYVSTINVLQQKDVVTRTRASVVKGMPLGSTDWEKGLVESLGLGYTQRGRGRPKK